MATAVRVPQRSRSKGKGKGHCVVEAIAWLRQVDARLPLSQTLWMCGVLLFLVGFIRGIGCLVRQSPSVVSVAAGIVCMAVAAIANKNGLARLLPVRCRHLLLHRTPFDLVFDQCVQSGLLRRWGRVLLLCQERSESEVRAIVRGLDPEFLDDVLQRSIVDMLPPLTRGLLLPGDPTSSASTEVMLHSTAMRHQGHTSMCYRAALGLPPVSVSAGTVSSRVHDGTELTVEEIQEVLQQKASQKKRLKSADPALSPLIDMLLKLGSVDGTLPAAARYVAHQGLHLASVTACASSGVWALSTLFFCTSLGRSTLQSIAFSGDARTASRRAGRMATILAAVSFLGAGACMTLAVHIRRHWLRTILPPTRGEVKLVQVAPSSACPYKGDGVSDIAAHAVPLIGAHEED
mmetsp:Transcript_6363/g.13904  ORF Transcript_6363/g.13904 Transcript_6363/m.13904 type:complete len:404 (+) Transcript_6363:131-1342(+)